MLTKDDLPPNYDLVHDTERCVAVLCHNGQPIPRIFMDHDCPVLKYAEESAIAFAIQSEAHPDWRFSRLDSAKWPAACQDATKWQRDTMGTLALAVKEQTSASPGNHSREPSNLMLLATLHGELLAYRQLLERLLPHSTDLGLIDQAINSALGGNWLFGDVVTKEAEETLQEAKAEQEEENSQSPDEEYENGRLAFHSGESNEDRWEAASRAELKDKIEAERIEQTTSCDMPPLRLFTGPTPGQSVATGRAI